jgi:hypothetical protein
MKKLTKKGVFNLNRVNINYTITNNYFDSNDPQAHCEFKSNQDTRPNILSETGYLSHFLGACTPDFSKLIENDTENLIREIVTSLARENKKIVRNLDFEELPEGKFERVTQGNLFDL